MHLFVECHQSWAEFDPWLESCLQPSYSLKHQSMLVCAKEIWSLRVSVLPVTHAIVSGRVKGETAGSFLKIKSPVQAVILNISMEFLSFSEFEAIGYVNITRTSEFVGLNTWGWGVFRKSPGSQKGNSLEWQVMFPSTGWLGLAFSYHAHRHQHQSDNTSKVLRY